MTRTSTLVACVLADGQHLALLDDAEELGLELERQLADLVEKQGPAAGGAHQAGVGLAGAGEGAAHVAEELALDELRADRRAVDGDELAAAAREPVHLGGDAAPCRSRSRR